MANFASSLAFPNFESTTAAYEYYSQMAASYGAPMAPARQENAVPLAGPTGEKEREDMWAVFTSHAPSAKGSTAEAITATNAPSQSFPEEGTVSSASLPPFTAHQAPLLPVSSPLPTTSQHSASSQATSHSLTNADQSASSANLESALESSTEFGSFASFTDTTTQEPNSTDSKKTHTESGSVERADSDGTTSAARATEKPPPTVYSSHADEWQEHALRQCLTQIHQGFISTFLWPVSCSCALPSTASVLFQQLIEVSDTTLLSKSLRSDKVDVYIRGNAESLSLVEERAKPSALTFPLGRSMCSLQDWATDIEGTANRCRKGAVVADQRRVGRVPGRHLRTLVCALSRLAAVAAATGES